MIDEIFRTEYIRLKIQMSSKIKGEIRHKLKTRLKQAKSHNDMTHSPKFCITLNNATLYLIFKSTGEANFMTESFLLQYSIKL
jgi:hypothetical protein